MRDAILMTVVAVLNWLAIPFCLWLLWTQEGRMLLPVVLMTLWGVGTLWWSTAFAIACWQEVREGKSDGLR